MMDSPCIETETRINKIKNRWESDMGVFCSSDLDPDKVLRGPFRSDGNVVLLITKGELNFNYEFDSFTIRERELFFIAEGALCEIVDSNFEGSFIGLAFTQDYLVKHGPVLSNFNLMRLFSINEMRKLSLSIEDYNAIKFHILSLKNKLELNIDLNPIKEIVQHGFLSVLNEVYFIQNKQASFVNYKPNRREELAKQFLNLLLIHFSKERKVNFYAKQLMVTPRHLSQIVKKVTGKTAGEIIDETVIKEAKVLLSENSLNVAQVSDALNFSNQSFFGKFFKKNTGVSPSNYMLNSNLLISSSPFKI